MATGIPGNRGKHALIAYEKDPKELADARQREVCFSVSIACAAEMYDADGNVSQDIQLRDQYEAFT